MQNFVHLGKVFHDIDKFGVHNGPVELAGQPITGSALNLNERSYELLGVELAAVQIDFDVMEIESQLFSDRSTGAVLSELREKPGKPRYFSRRKCLLRVIEYGEIAPKLHQLSDLAGGELKQVLHFVLR